MSFTKAKVKRFNELDGCGPPVGSYDPKLNDGTTTSLFLRSERFKNGPGCVPPVGSYDPKLNDGSTTPLFSRSERFKHGAESLESSTSSIELSAKKNAYFKKPYFSKRQNNVSAQAEFTKVQECEKEIRRLLKERSDLLKQLSSKEEEMKKMEGKLQTVMRERSHFQANMATIEKEAKELRRANDILKMKVNTLEGVSKAKDLRVELANLRAVVIEKDHIIMDLKQELNSVKQEHEKCSLKLTDKDNEIKRVNDEMILTIRNLEHELEISKDQICELEAQKNNLVFNNDEMTSQVHSLQNKIQYYESAIKDLSQQKEMLKDNVKDYNQDLEIKKQQMNEIVEELRNENSTLVSRIEEQTNRRRSEEKLLSAELDNAYRKLDVTEDCSRALQEYRDVLAGRVTVLQECVDELEGQQSLDMQTIKELKHELLNITTCLAEKEQALSNATKNVISLNETIDELKSAHEQLQSMTKKCTHLEEELNCREVDHKELVDKLEVEVLVTKLSYEVSEQELADLRQQLPELQSILDTEQHHCKQLQVENEQQKSDSHKALSQLNDEIIKVQNECCAKEEEIARLEDVIATHSSQIKALTEQLELEMEEKNKLENLSRVQAMHCSELEAQFDIAKQKKLELETALLTSNSLLESLQKETATEKRTMENEMATLRSKNENMHGDISMLLLKESVLKAQVTDYVVVVSAANAKVDKVEQENAELTSFLTCKEIEAKELKSELDDYKVKFSESQTEKNKLKGSNKDMAKQMENLETKCTAHVKLYEETKEEVKQKSEQLDTLNAECETIQTMFSEMYEEKNNLEMEFRNLSRQLFNATEALTSEQDKCMELKGKLNKKIHEVKTLNDKLQEANEKCRLLQTDIEATEERTKMLESMCQRLENQIEDKDHNLANFQHEMQGHLSTLSENLEKVLTEKHEIEGLFLDSKNAEKSLKEELSHNLEAMQSLNLLLEQSRSEVSDLQVEVDLLSNVLAEKQQTVVELSDNLLKSQTQLESLTMDIEKKDEVISTMKCVNENLEKDLQDALEYKNLAIDLREELTCITAELHQLKPHLENAESQITTLQSEVSALKNCIVEKEQSILEQSAKYGSINEAMTALTDQLKHKDETINNIMEECNSLQESLEHRHGEIAELKTVIETNKQLISETKDNSIIEDLHNANSELESLYEACHGQQELIKKMDSEKEDLRNRIKELETEMETQSAQIQWLADREEKLLREIDLVEEDAKLKQQEYIRVIRETQKQCAQFESDRYKQLKEIEGRQNEEMLQALTNEYESRAQLQAQHIDQLRKESLSWKSQFEDLHAKVAPFQDQLDAYEAERNMMMSKTNETLSDFQKLSQQYATLLGHQNHKQKIQHVCKLKEEILSLKDEKAKLTSENMKLKKQLQRRDGNVPSSARKFDPSKAFQHPNKENDTSLREFPSNFRQY